MHRVKRTIVIHYNTIQFIFVRPCFQGWRPRYGISFSIQSCWLAFQIHFHLDCNDLGFYRGALNAGRSSQEKAVCLSVKRVDCDKTEERSVHIFIPYERLFSLVF